MAQCLLCMLMINSAFGLNMFNLNQIGKCNNDSYHEEFLSKNNIFEIDTIWQKAKVYHVDNPYGVQ